ncbi:MAG: DUF2784 domain-containing protein [Betaproteobacteria bacterium]
MAPLADLVLAIHFLFVLFVAAGLPAVWVGAIRGWRWVRNFRFRFAHLAATLFVAAESLIGITCPLTAWEDLLRRAETGRSSFMQRWVVRLLYYNLPEWMFTVAYVLFALLVLASLQLVRPHWPGGQSHEEAG